MFSYHIESKLHQKLLFLESFFYNVASLYSQGYSESEIFKALGLKENIKIKYLSHGQLSKMNMVKSVINDIKK